MVRQLPIVDIGDTKFFVDVRLEEFREVENPHNRIPFNNLKDEINHYTFLYDQQTKNVYKGTSVDKEKPSHVQEIKLPLITELDLTGVQKLFKQSQKREEKEEQKKMRKGHGL